MRITSGTLTVPPTPPPDIDIEAWRESLQTVRDWRPDRLAVTHFGLHEDVEAQLAELDERLGRWGDFAREHDREEFIAMMRAEIGADAGGELEKAYEQAAAPDQLYAGLARYWRKRAERAQVS